MGSIMPESETLVNALHHSVVNRMDPQFAEIYTKYQGNNQQLLSSHEPH